MWPVQVVEDLRIGLDAHRGEDRGVQILRAGSQRPRVCGVGVGAAIDLAAANASAGQYDSLGVRVVVAA